MKLLHGPNGYQYAWFVIPVVGLFVWLYNSWKLGKFRHMTASGKIKVLGVMILAVVAGGCLLDERVLDSYLIPAEQLSAYPELEEEYLRQDDAAVGQSIVVVEVGNLFQSREVYLLPCYETEIRNVPRYGNSHWITEVLILGGEDEVSLRNLELQLDVGQETMISSRVELNGGQWLYDMGTDLAVKLEKEISLPAGEGFRVLVTASTSGTAETENLTVPGAFAWNYDLYYDNAKVAEIRDDIISGTYIVNAT